MKKIDEITRQKMMANSDNTSSKHSNGGALQNRLSAKLDAEMSGEGEARKSASAEESTPNIVRHGYGVQYWNDGAHYEGQWNYNKAEGLGTFWHAEGDVYHGEFKNDMANGFGEYTHINGSKYKGEFRDDV